MLIRASQNGDRYVGTLRLCVPNSKFILSREVSSYQSGILYLTPQQFCSMLEVKQEPPSFLNVTAVKMTILQIDVMKLDLESLLTANSCNTLLMAEDISVVTETLFSRDSQFVVFEPFCSFYLSPAHSTGERIDS